MAIVDILNLLEDKLHYILLRYTQISEENVSLKEEILKVKKSNEKLIAKIDNLEGEKKQFNVIRENVISKVEKLVYQLSIDDAEDNESNSEGIIEEEIELGESSIDLDESLEESLPGDSSADFLSSSTTINFLPDEGS